MNLGGELIAPILPKRDTGSQGGGQGYHHYGDQGNDGRPYG
jgi:hypothetical protein